MYTILSTSTTIGWLVLMIILLLIEIPTVGLTTIWGVVGAFVAMLLSMVGVPIVAQFIVFFIVTAFSVVPKLISQLTNSAGFRMGKFIIVTCRHPIISERDISSERS